MLYTKEELCLIWLDSFMGLEYKHKNELYKTIVSSTRIKSAIEKLKDYITSNVSDKAYNLLINSANEEYLKGLLEQLDRKGIKVVTIVSKEYPENLKNIDIPPLVLYTMGDTSLLSKNLFGIVGSRKSLSLSLALAKDYSTELIKHDQILVTGTADGVDSVVIKTALELNKPVVSVVAGGFSHVYPSINASLIEKVAKVGLVISEHPIEVKPMPYFFPVRNRIIAGLSKGVLIVSASKKSGTLYTAEYAGAFGKDLFAVPYSVGIKSGEGCNELIKSGAILTDSPKDILNFYGLCEKTDQTSCDMELTGEEKEVLELLSNGELHVEKISEKLNKKTYEIIPLLSVLEIKGLVYKNGANVYGRVK